MKTLIVYGKEHDAEKIVKTDTAIIGYKGETEVFAFRGISDFSIFKLADGQEFDVDDAEIKAKTLAQLILENADLRQQLQIGGVK